MNFGAPAQCNGAVTSWHYCLYNNYSEEECNEFNTETISLRSGFLAYRQTGPTTYEIVPGSAKRVFLSLSCSETDKFQCREEKLSQDEQFEIQENDIVAACLDINGIYDPIPVVGEERSNTSNYVYDYNANDNQKCSIKNFRTIHTERSNYHLAESGIRYRLHLYAETASM